jgi:methionyl-tRNA formyltransferase
MHKNNKIDHGINFAFFGTSVFSVTVLDELKSNGLIPSLIVTVEDKPKGRKLILTPPETKIWAEKEKIPCLQLKTLKNEESISEIVKYQNNGFDLFVVASYGKIIPKNVLGIPKYKTLNIHPSLLPKFRGASPIQSAILKENETGVTIIRLDEEVDHGPILAQKNTTSWNTETIPYAEDLEKTLGIAGANLLAEIVKNWIDGKINETEQDHANATFCEKIEKINGELKLSDTPETNLRKIRAYHSTIGTYFFDDFKGIHKRIVVKTAHIENNALVIDRVIPESKKEMSYEDYLRGKN